MDDTEQSSIRDELHRHGGTVSHQCCPDCSDTTLIDIDNETVCPSCYQVIGSHSDRHRMQTEDDSSSWETFWDQRPYWNGSEQPICVGGYPSAHEWIEPDAVNCDIADCDPETFYR